MPIYEYRCIACGHQFDTIQSFSEEALTKCPSCGDDKLEKLISAPAFHLKGTGWYVTDFKNKKTVGSAPTGSESKEQHVKEKTQQKGDKKEAYTESKDKNLSTTAKKADKAE